MADVFISYSRKNSDFARKLTDKLRQSGKESWVDWEGIPLSSANWWNEIKTGIEQGDSFVFIMSPDSMASVVCNMELDYALALQKRVIIVVYEEVQSREFFASLADYVPDNAMKQRLSDEDPLNIARDNWQRISHINWLFFRDEDDFDSQYEKLITTVETDLPYVKAHTRYLARAREWQQNNERVDLLLFGEEIEIAEAWLQTAKGYAQQAKARSSDEKFEVVNPLPDDLHWQYITTSRQAETERQNTLRNLRLTGIVAGIIGVVAIVAGIVAGLAAVNASNQSSTATVGQGVAINAQNTAIAAQDTSIAQEASATVGQGLAIEQQNTAIAQQNEAEERAQEANTQVALANSTATQSAIESQRLQAQGNSILLAAQARDIYDTEQFSLALRLAYEANNMQEPPVQSQFILSQLAYAPGERLQFPNPDGVQFNAVKISPNENQLVTYDNRSQLLLWDIATMNVVHRFTGISDVAVSLAFSPDGSMLAVGSFFGDGLQMFDTQTGELLWNDLSFTGIGVNSMTFSPNGEQLLVGLTQYDPQTMVLREQFGIVAIYDMTAGQRRMYSDNEALESVNSVAYSPDGEQFVAGTSAGELLIFDTQTISLKTQYSYPTTFSQLAISPDGTRIIFGINQSIRVNERALVLADIETGEILREFQGIETSKILAFSPIGDRIYADTTVLNVNTGNIESTYPTFSLSIDYSADRTWFASAGNTLSIVDVNNASILWQTSNASCSSLIVTLDNTAILCDRNLLDLQTGEMIRRYEDVYSYVRSVAYSPDGQQILFGTDELKTQSDVAENIPHMVQLGAETGDIVQDFIVSDSTSRVAWSYDGTLTLSSGNSVQLRDSTNGILLREYPATRALFIPNTTYELLLAGNDGVRRIDVQSGTTLQTYDEQYRSLEHIITLSGENFGISRVDNSSLILWDLANGNLLQQYEGHSSLIFSVAVSPDGSEIAAASNDTVIIWDTLTGEVKRRFDNLTQITAITFSRDGSRLISSSIDGLIVWRNDDVSQLQKWVRENRYLPELSCQQRVTYNLSSCTDDTFPITVTFAPTHTPYPLPTVPQVTAIPIASQTPSNTPTMTLTPTSTLSPTPSSTPTPRQD